MSQIIDSVLALLLMLGALLLFAAALGLVRGADVFARIQSVAKSGSVGSVVLLIAVAIAAGEAAVFVRALAAAAIVLLNALLMAQMLAEAADSDTLASTQDIAASPKE